MMRGFLERLTASASAGSSGRSAVGGPTREPIDQLATSHLSADEKARHEAAARAVLRSMAENPPAAALGMPESPPADMPARGGNLSAVRGEEAFAETMRV